MNPGTEVTVKCSYAQLIDPETEKPLFSLQGIETAGYPFGTIVSNQEKYAVVQLNDEAVEYLTDKRLKGKIQTILSGNRKVLVKKAAVIESELVPKGEEPEHKQNSGLTWLLIGAAILAFA